MFILSTVNCDVSEILAKTVESNNNSNNKASLGSGDFTIIGTNELKNLPEFPNLGAKNELLDDDDTNDSNGDVDNIETLNRNGNDEFNGYHYDKPEIPFEFDKQPSDQSEIFQGYQYPKPDKPFELPTTTTTEIPFLPDGSARLLDN